MSDRTLSRITTAIVSTSLTFVVTIAALLIVEPPRHDTVPTTGTTSAQSR